MSITKSNTRMLDGIGTSANNLVQLDANAKLPAVDGSQLTGLVAMPSGGIMPFGGSSAPTGFLVCDGAAISRTTNATLFAAIGTTWGVGDGSSTFNVPDLRAMFLRGSGTHGTADMAKGTDFSAPAVGTIENDQMQDHKHQTIMSPGTSPNGYDSYTIGNNAYNTTYNFNTTAPQETNSQGAPRVGDETRPVNASVLYVIKT
jgi:microcystin-dependent protein